MGRSRLLIDERVIAVQPSLVRALGLTKAVVLQQIHWHLEAGGHGKLHADGEEWFPVTQDVLADEIGLTRPIVRQAIDALEAAGIVLACQPEGHRSRRKWYRIDHSHVLFVQVIDPSLPKPQIDHIPSDETITSSTTKTSKEQVPMSTSLTLVDDPIILIFNAWQEATGRRRTILDKTRRRAILEALGRGHPFEDCVDACRGVMLVPHNQGATNGRRYDDITLVLRDAEHVEKFRDAYRGENQARARAGPLGATVSLIEKERANGTR